LARQPLGEFAKRIEPSDAKPLTRQVEEILRQAILRGDLPQAARVHPVRDLSRRFNVGKSTVARAISNLRREGLLSARPGRGTYVVTRPGEAQRVISGCLGLVWDGSASSLHEIPYYGRLYEFISVQAALRQQRVLLLPLRAETSRFHGLRHIATLEQEGHIDGLIYLVNWRVQERLVTLAVTRRLPLVVVDCCPDSRRADAVVVDNAAGARQLTERLLQLGHRRIALVTSTQDNINMRERVQSIRATLAAAGLRLPSRLIIRLNPPGLQGGREAFRQLVSLAPTAIVACNRYVAAGVILEAERAGRSVPRDLSVCAFGSANDAVPGFDRGLTVAAFDLEEMAVAAVECLGRRLQDAKAPYRILRVRMFVRDEGTIGVAP